MMSYSLTTSKNFNLTNDLTSKLEEQYTSIEQVMTHESTCNYSLLRTHHSILIFDHFSFPAASRGQWWGYPTATMLDFERINLWKHYMMYATNKWGRIKELYGVCLYASMIFLIENIVIKPLSSFLKMWKEKCFFKEIVSL